MELKKGDIFNNLTMIRQVENDKYGNRVFECKCKCGNLKNVAYSKLIRGHTKSCGCLNHTIVDLVGVRNRRLIVTSFNRLENRVSYWNIKCDCGNEIVLSNSAFKQTLSCGCLNDEVRKSTVKSRMGFVDGTSLSAIKKRTIKKNNSSGITGVSFDEKRGKWVAQIMFKRKTYNLGRFDDKSDAINARLKAEEEYFDNFINKYEKTSN